MHSVTRLLSDYQRHVQGGVRLRWCRQWRALGLLALFCLTVLLAAHGWSEHVPQLEWMAPYRAADGGSCCGITDCFRAQVTLLSEPTDEFVRVLVSSVQDWDYRQVWVNTVVIVPGRSIYRSEDAQSWYCSNTYFQTWTAAGEETNQACYTDESYAVRTECVRCIFVNFGA
jgi:hypothetical protein